jgi:hypothetical protein
MTRLEAIHFPTEFDLFLCGTCPPTQTLQSAASAGLAAGLRGPEPPNRYSPVTNAAKRPSAARRPLELMNDFLLRAWWAVVCAGGPG